jgi:two-component system response regulator DegU
MFRIWQEIIVMEEEAMDAAELVVVASNALICRGVEVSLDKSDCDIHIAGTFTSILECEQFLKLPSQKMRIVLLDDDAAGSKPIPSIRRLLQRYPHLKLVVMSGLLNELYIQRIMACGVVGYLYTQDRLETTLVTCIHAVADGHIFLSPQASVLPYNRIVIDEFNQTDMAVLQLMDTGYTCNEIAERLNIVARTVYRIRRKLRDHLHVRTTEQIVEAARQQGLLRQKISSPK